jgi:GDPmannose 4,6-dehydratase
MNVLISGITGQDGSYLADLLLRRGYKVFGIVRRSSTSNLSRIEPIKDKITLIQGDLLDQSSLIEAMKIAKPTLIFSLAAQSYVPLSWTEPLLTTEYTAVGQLRMLEAMRQVCPEAKMFFAASSEMFGKVIETPQNEQTPFYPRSPYGVAKTFGYYITKNYRESYHLYACSGIMFNHESHRRGFEFVSRKITNGIAKILTNKIDHIELGNIYAKRDWGYSPDYMEAAHEMLLQAEPKDYVISTGATHTIKEFCNIAFNIAEMPIVWEKEGLDEIAINMYGHVVVKIDKNLYRPAEVDLLLGDSTKIKEEIGWKPKYSFSEMIKDMVINDLNIERNKNG